MGHRRWRLVKRPAGLIRKDGSTKPAYEELLKLIRGEWWISPTRFVTDDYGKIQFSGFLGEYELEYQGFRKLFSVSENGTFAKEIRLG